MLSRELRSCFWFKQVIVVSSCLIQKVLKSLLTISQTYDLLLSKACLEEVKSEDPDLDSQKEAVFVAHVKQDVLKLATRSPLDSARAELSKKTNAVNRKEQLMVGVIESDCRETLLRFKRSKKAFGAHIAGNQRERTADGTLWSDEVLARRQFFQQVASAIGPGEFDAADGGAEVQHAL
jgi:hypothetical protein